MTFQALRNQALKNKSQSNLEKFDIFRQGFPAFDTVTYFSICDKMILHRDVRLGVDAFLDYIAYPTARGLGYEDKVLASREKFAKLMNADASSVAAVRNVSEGINIIAWALPMEDGDNVVIALDHEHPNNIYPWLRLHKRGVELRKIAARPDGQLDIEAMIDAIDAKTKLMTCASVSYAPGHRADLRRLGEACRKRDVFLLVDGIQSAGILKHDFMAEPIDGFATSTAKGLLGLYGFGFLYVSPKWIDRMEPAYLARSSVIVDDSLHSTMCQLHYELQPDSRRFEVGSFNFAGAYAADTSLDLLLDLGIDDIEAYVLALGRDFYDGVSECGLTPVGAREGETQSGILTIGEIDKGGHNYSDDPVISRISEHLFEAHIVHSIRRGQLRFGLHAYNNSTDVAQTVACITDALKG